MNSVILQLNPQIKVLTPFGFGWTFFLIDYGLDVNTIWVVRLEDGTVKHFDSNDIKVDGNPMIGTKFLKKDLDI